jgi:putative lipoprotein
MLIALAVAACAPRPTNGETASISLRGQTVLLPHVPAASGAKYSDAVDTFWSQGREALLEADGGLHRNCRSGAAPSPWENAKSRGVDFRATGNEPGWHLKIRDGEEILFVTDYGRTRVLTLDPGPGNDAVTPRITYTAQMDAHRLVVIIDPRPCTDTMSGEEFTATVAVSLDAWEYRGCGRALLQED